ncbi:MAG: C25 family cysteine peptidase [Deltaproteobacteria bacterium]
MLAIAMWLGAVPAAYAAGAPGYLIVTTAAVRGASTQLDAFVAHKEERGFVVRVRDEIAIGSSGLVADAAAEALHSYLQALAPADVPEYLLIIGDPRTWTGPFPMKTTWPRTPGSVGTSPTGYVSTCNFTQIAVPTDYYYGELDGNWDLDGDGLYGEFGQFDAVTTATGDFGAGGIEVDYEIAVGRIPFYGDPNDATDFANHIVDLDHILAKTIDYQSALLDEIGWRMSALIATEGANRFHYGEAIRDDLLVPAGFAPIFRAYDSAACTLAGNCNPVLTDPPDVDSCSIPNVSAGWLATHPGIVTWLTHGGGWGAVSVMSTSNTAALDDDYPTITFQASCLNSSPNSTNNVSYALLKNGAVATVGATQISHGPGSPVDLVSDAHQAGNAGMGYGFTRRVAVDELSVGHALMQVKRESSLYGRCWYWQNFLTFNIYGDPEVSLFSHGWPELDAFMSYKARGLPGSARPVKFGPLVLSDALIAAAKFDIHAPRSLARPANDDGEAIGESAVHLTEYKVKQRGSAFAGVSHVSVTNRCNDFLLDVKKPVSLLATAAAGVLTAPPILDPALHNVDHFLCYKAKASKRDADGNKLPRFPKGMQAVVSDGQQTRRYDLKKPTKLCLPVRTSVDALDPPVLLSGSAKGDPKTITPAAARNEDALVCYLARIAKKEIPQDGCGCDTALSPHCGGTVLAQAATIPTAAYTGSTLGRADVIALKESELCLPSSVVLP